MNEVPATPTAWSLGVKVLYKFRPFRDRWADYVRETIQESTVYFSRAHQLNDPFDLQPPARFTGDPKDPAFMDLLVRDVQRVSKGKARISKRLEKMEQLRRHPNPSVLAEETERLTRATLDRHTFILSLSASRRHPLLWSHYSDSHRGVCLHFDSRQGSPFDDARVVRYRRLRPFLPIPLDTVASLNLVERVALTKAPWWKYEREYRLLGHSTDAAFGFKSDGQHAAFHPKWLIGITLGLRISARAEAELIDLAGKHTPALKVWKAVEAPSYRLRFTELRSANLYGKFPPTGG